MASDRRFAIGLAAWLVALVAAAVSFAAALVAADLAMVRVLAGVGIIAAALGLWRHISRTNRMLAQFVEALHHRDLTARFDRRGGAAFDAVSEAMNVALRTMQAEREAAERDLRFHEALLEDAPVAVLTVDDAHGVRVANKAARRLFDRHDGVRPADFERYGASFARLLAEPGMARRELVILTLPGGLQRALVQLASVQRLDTRTRVVTIEPLQGTLDAIEVAAQTDLVRVLTHEILNSLTPIVSLARTADELLDGDAVDPDGARLAIATLNRRTQGLLAFISAYRSVARPPAPRAIAFEAQPFLRELARLFAAEWPAAQLELAVEAELALTADPDLLAQAIINLLRNAAQATAPLGSGARIELSARREGARIRIDVEDNGPGVPEAQASDVFLPFFTTKAEGSGVGLNLVRQIVVASGGAIELSRSRLGGARFSISL